LSVVSDLFVGSTSAIDGYCCCCCWDCKSTCNPTGIGGSSNIAGGGGIITTKNYIFLNINNFKKITLRRWWKCMWN
jgi:hypothetical protein